MSIQGAALGILTSAGLALTAMLLLPKRRQTDKNEWDAVLEFWFRGEGSSGWFLEEGPQRDKLDKLISDKFGKLLVHCIHGECDWWIDMSAGSHSGILALIIVLDQFSRHCSRVTHDDHLQIMADRKAQQLTARAILQGTHEIVRGDELGFLLMPYRHKKPLDMALLEDILRIVDEREKRALQEKSALSRFKRVTESRLSAARSQYELDHHTDAKIYTDAEILQPPPACDNDLFVRLSDENRGLVWKCLNLYLSQHGIDSSYLMVSLSGGVDSMVIMTVLADQITRKGLGITLVAAHIDYCNRGESHSEADFVARYAEGLGVRCFVKRIAGLLRGVTERDEYEAKSREIRFDFYKEIWYDHLGAPGKPLVLLGHHQGDVVENVLSNAMKGKTLLELSGMSVQSDISDCIIRRPLLTLTKDHIFDYAHRFKVPYFKDTTPRWSTRGQVRLEVLPCLERVYGKGFQSHLARLAEQSDEAFDLLMRDFFRHRVVSSHQLRMKRDLPFAFVADLTKDMSSKPLFMWRLALREAAHDHGVLVATDKAVKFLYDNFACQSRLASSTGWFVELRRGSRGYVWGNRFLVVFRFEPSVIIPQPEEPIFLQPDQQAFRFGYWEIVLSRCAVSTTILSLTMDLIWNAFVANPTEDLKFVYSVDESSDGLYRLATTQQTVKSLEVDLPLRNALLPVVLPNCPPSKRGIRNAINVCIKWVGRNE